MEATISYELTKEDIIELIQRMNQILEEEEQRNGSRGSIIDSENVEPQVEEEEMNQFINSMPALIPDYELEDPHLLDRHSSPIISAPIPEELEGGWQDELKGGWQDGLDQELDEGYQNLLDQKFYSDYQPLAYELLFVGRFLSKDFHCAVEEPSRDLPLKLLDYASHAGSTVKRQMRKFVRLYDVENRRMQISTSNMLSKHRELKLLLMKYAISQEIEELQQDQEELVPLILCLMQWFKGASLEVLEGLEELLIVYINHFHDIMLMREVGICLFHHPVLASALQGFVSSQISSHFADYEPLTIASDMTFSVPSAVDGPSSRSNLEEKPKKKRRNFWKTLKRMFCCASKPEEHEAEELQ